MTIDPIQLICHLFGDYVLQSSWMAVEKTKRLWPATVHSFVYYIPFLVVMQPSNKAAVAIIGTHILIDRLALARYVCFAGNFIAPPIYWLKWADCKKTGYHEKVPAVPAHRADWLNTIVDNTMHLTINAICLAYL
jgi:uncharacterized membrane protein